VDSMDSLWEDLSRDVCLIWVPGVGDLIAQQSSVGDALASPPAVIMLRAQNEGMYWVLTAFARAQGRPSEPHLSCPGAAGRRTRTWAEARLR
jgi:hypothetical protein